MSKCPAFHVGEPVNTIKIEMDLMQIKVAYDGMFPAPKA